MYSQNNLFSKPGGYIIVVLLLLLYIIYVVCAASFCDCETGGYVFVYVCVVSRTLDEWGELVNHKDLQPTIPVLKAGHPVLLPLFFAFCFCFCFCFFFVGLSLFCF